jgi:hypothetical protein
MINNKCKKCKKWRMVMVAQMVIANTLRYGRWIGLHQVGKAWEAAWMLRIRWKLDIQQQRLLVLEIQSTSAKWIGRRADVQWQTQCTLAQQCTMVDHLAIDPTQHTRLALATTNVERQANTRVSRNAVDRHVVELEPLVPTQKLLILGLCPSEFSVTNVAT